MQRRSPKSTAGGDAFDRLYDRYVRGKPEAEKRYEEIKQGSVIAQQIYDLRTAAGLTQAQLAKMIKTTPSVISRLEDNDYSGHSLSMLNRIAAALGRRVEVRFVRLTVPVAARKAKAPATKRKTPNRNKRKPTASP